MIWGLEFSRVLFRSRSALRSPFLAQWPEVPEPSMLAHRESRGARGGGRGERKGNVARWACPERTLAGPGIRCRFPAGPGHLAPGELPSPGDCCGNVGGSGRDSHPGAVALLVLLPRPPGTGV